MCMALDRWGEIADALMIRDERLSEEARRLLSDVDAGRDNTLNPAVTEPTVAEPTLAGKE